LIWKIISKETLQYCSSISNFNKQKNRSRS